MSTVILLIKKEWFDMTPQEKANKLVLEFEQKLYGHSVTDEKWVKCIEASLLCVDSSGGGKIRPGV